MFFIHFQPGSFHDVTSAVISAIGVAISAPHSAHLSELTSAVLKYGYSVKIYR